MALYASLVFSLLFLAALGLCTSSSSSPPPCRFASSWTPTQLLSSPNTFENTLLHWEGKFHQHNVSYNTLNGMTFDGTLLDPVTGIHNVDGLHTFSAPSKESLHFMMLANVIDGNEGAVRWILSGEGYDVGINDEEIGEELKERAREVAVGILMRKWESYGSFNETFPGFGGFLPW
jgi:hypothetical protein